MKNMPSGDQAKSYISEGNLILSVDFGLQCSTLSCSSLMVLLQDAIHSPATGQGLRLNAAPTAPSFAVFGFAGFCFRLVFSGKINISIEGSPRRSTVNRERLAVRDISTARRCWRPLATGQGNATGLQLDAFTHNPSLLLLVDDDDDDTSSICYPQSAHDLIRTPLRLFPGFRTPALQSPAATPALTDLSTPKDHPELV